MLWNSYLLGPEHLKYVRLVIPQSILFPSHELPLVGRSHAAIDVPLAKVLSIHAILVSMATLVNIAAGATPSEP
jgi:hypothetical protein